MGLVILRVKEPTLHRPYRTWIITPLVFLRSKWGRSSAPASASPGLLREPR